MVKPSRHSLTVEFHPSWNTAHSFHIRGETRSQHVHDSYTCRDRLQKAGTSLSWGRSHLFSIFFFPEKNYVSLFHISKSCDCLKSWMRLNLGDYIWRMKDKGPLSIHSFLGSTKGKVQETESIGSLFKWWPLGPTEPSVSVCMELIHGYLYTKKSHSSLWSSKASYCI